MARVASDQYRVTGRRHLEEGEIGGVGEDDGEWATWQFGERAVGGGLSDWAIWRTDGGASASSTVGCWGAEVKATYLSHRALPFSVRDLQPGFPHRHSKVTEHHLHQPCTNN
jgi:hypothetical protein